MLPTGLSTRDSSEHAGPVPCEGAVCEVAASHGARRRRITLSLS